MKTLIITADIENVERGELEALANVIFEDVEQLRTTFIDPVSITVYTLRDFMFSFNNEEIADSGLWLGYVQVKK